MPLRGGLLEDVVQRSHIRRRRIRFADPPAGGIRWRRIAHHHRVVGVERAVIGIRPFPDGDR